MKNNIFYIGLAVIVGLLAGYFIFNNDTEDSTPNNHNHSQAIATGEMWTCSMHPQIMQPESGSCPICAMDLIPAESEDDGLTIEQFKMTKNAMALANIRTTIVGKHNNDQNTLQLSGTITENEDEIVTQPAHFNGRIDELYITSLGESVKIGQAIAKVYSPELVAAQQELITAYGIKESQPRLYEAVRSKFKNWKINDVQLSEIEISGEVRPSFTIYSLISGVVTEIMANEGDHIMNGLPIFKVTNLKSVWAKFDAYENQVSMLEKGQNIKMITNAYPNKEFNAQISFIDPILNSSTRTIQVRAVLQNKKDLLKPGMFIAGTIQLPSNKSGDTLIIPESAVLWTGERSVVYLKPNTNEPIFEIRQITLGDAINGGYIVLEGLKNGDEIVTNGAFTVDAAAQLKGKKSMMNEDGGRTVMGHEGHSEIEMNETKVSN